MLKELINKGKIKRGFVKFHNGGIQIREWTFYGDMNMKKIESDILQEVVYCALKRIKELAKNQQQLTASINISRSVNNGA